MKTLTLFATLTVLTAAPSYEPGDPLGDALARYREAVLVARDVYLEELREARLEAVARGDLAAATEILELSARVETHSVDDFFDPFLETRRDVAQSRWTQSDGNKSSFPTEKTGGWAVVDKNVVAQYVEKSGNLYIWTMNDEHDKAVIRRWLPDTRFQAKTAKRND